MKRDEPHQMRIRISKELHAELEAEAANKSISINSEVLNRLQSNKERDLEIKLQDLEKDLIKSHLRMLCYRLGMSINSVRMLLKAIKEGTKIDEKELAEILEDSHNDERELLQSLARWEQKTPPNALTVALEELSDNTDGSISQLRDRRKRTVKGT